jgi:hypothetical protein
MDNQNNQGWLSHIEISKIPNGLQSENKHHRAHRKKVAIFLVPQNVPVIRYRRETTGKPLYTILRPPAWGDQVIGQIFKDLLLVNPGIELDEYAGGFLAKAQ